MALRWVAVAGIAGGSALVAVEVARDHALEIQVVGAVAGATLAIGGSALTAWAWPDRRRSELCRLLASLGFLVACVGALAMGAGIGILH